MFSHLGHHPIIQNHDMAKPRPLVAARDSLVRFKGTEKRRIYTDSYAPNPSGRLTQYVHTTYIFRYPVIYGKLPGFLKQHPEFSTIEIPAGSMGQTALGVAMTLSAAGLEKRFQKSSEPGREAGGIFVTDKFHPENMQISKDGIVSSVERSNENSDQFAGMALHWRNILKLIAPEKELPLERMLDPTPRNEDYPHYLQKNAKSATPLEYTPPNRQLGTTDREIVKGWQAARDRERLYQLRDDYQQRLGQMLHFETERAWDAIDVIRQNPSQVQGPRLILLQGVVHLLSPEERENLLDALKTLKKGSVVIFGVNEFIPYRGEVFVEDFFQKFFKKTGFKPIGNDQHDLNVYSQLHVKDGWDPRLDAYELPGGYIKTTSNWFAWMKNQLFKNNK